MALGDIHSDTSTIK